MATTCKRLWAGLLFLMLAMTSIAAQADVKVGDKPVIDWQSVDGQRITSEKLSGRIVILDFWATWCGPCMMEVPHMVELNKTYKDKGVRIIGISLDKDINRMTQVTKEKGLDWPQICDGKGLDGSCAEAFDIKNKGIPTTFILSAEGQVLWRGHPIALDQILPQVLAKYPPTFKEKDRARATELLNRGTAELKKGQWTSLAAILADLPDGPLSEAEMLDTIRAFMGAYDHLAGTSTITARKMSNAVSADAQAAASFAAMRNVVPLGKGDEAAANPPTAPAHTEANNAKLAAIRLRNAEQYREAGKDIEAYRLYKQIVEQYADTDAAAKARPRVEAYEKDVVFMAKVALAAQEEEATRYLMMARSYFETSRMEQAIEQCDQILQKFPHTDCAKEAAQIKRNAQQAK